MGSEVSSCCLLGMNGMSLDDRVVNNKDAVVAAVVHLVLAGECNALIKVLDDSSVDLCNISWKYGLTPLHIAAMKGHFETLKVLLNHGFNPDTVDHWGRTALHWAGRNRNKVTYQYLTILTSNKQSADVYGITAAMFFNANVNFSTDAGCSQPQDSSKVHTNIDSNKESNGTRYQRGIFSLEQFPIDTTTMIPHVSKDTMKKYLQYSRRMSVMLLSKLEIQRMDICLTIKSLYNSHEYRRQIDTKTFKFIDQRETPSPSIEGICNAKSISIMERQIQTYYPTFDEYEQN